MDILLVVILDALVDGLIEVGFIDGLIVGFILGCNVGFIDG